MPSGRVTSLLGDVVSEEQPIANCPDCEGRRQAVDAIVRSGGCGSCCRRSMGPPSWASGSIGLMQGKLTAAVAGMRTIATWGRRQDVVCIYAESIEALNVQPPAEDAK